MALQRKSISPRVRFAVLSAGGFRCRYCGRRPPKVILNIDHLIPVSRGGTNEPDNLVVSCATCNNGKSDGLLPRTGPQWTPVMGNHPFRCADDRHQGIWTEYVLHPTDGSPPDIVLECSTCHFIVAHRPVAA